MTTDLRTNHRFPCHARFVGAGGARSLRGEVQDLSETGLSLLTNAPVARGQGVHLQFALPAGEVDVVGEVRWMRPDGAGRTEVGLRFVRIPMGATEAIRQAVQHPSRFHSRLLPGYVFA